MKKYVIICCLAFVILSAFVMRKHTISSIYGSIDPPESVSKVMAINEKERDTLVVIPAAGIFSIAVPPGMYTLYFVAVKPYQDRYAERIRVQDDKSTNVGVIRITK